MKFTLPIIVEAHPVEATRETEYRVRPVFIPHVEGRSRQLTRAISRLTAETRKTLREVAKEQRHERLAEMVFSPELEGTRLSVTIGLRRRSVVVKLLIVTLESLGRTVAFATGLPDLWFEVSHVRHGSPDPAVQSTEGLRERSESDNHSGDVRSELRRSRETRAERSTLVARAEEVLSEHFRKRELEDGDQFMPPERYALAANAWVTTIDLDLHVPEVRRAPLKELFATLGDGEVLEGADELETVGHCLDRSYPDDLDRVVLRDREVAELSRLLTAAGPRPVLLLGPRHVGKTAIVHESIFRKVDEHKDPYRNERNVWWLSPQRLISGMSYVGQWENRLIAILKEAAKHEHVLFFDDVLGLYLAGQSSQSSLSVAHVLKPYVERGEVRLLAEMTPEAFRVLRERDRGFADLFHIIPIQEPAPADTLRILMHTQRQLEDQFEISFEADALPQVLDVTRRYARSEAFPGKAVRLLKRLAVATAPNDIDNSASRRASAPGRSLDSRNVRGPTPSGSPEPVIDSRAVLSAFHEQSGLPLAFLDLDQKLSPAEIADGLRRRFVGQEAAVSAAAEVIGIAKARLNDPDRPLASMLLLGPTGVGKTQFAKSLAEYLFGSGERLIRFDMNEYVSAASVPQLIGTFRNPEGLLTSAVRRSPFAVVLFDELEKAHPDVFDLLLQVLGEGRLTDALGRTTDFTNTLILLTSNLGVQRSDTGLGFGSRDEHAKSASIKAAENFFRPEFFNRLDRVLAFDRLSRDDMRRVASLMLDDVFHREGLTRRRVVPVVSPDAVEWIVSQGYEPILGARALRRALERELVRPIAAQLAAQTPSGLTVIQVNRAEKGLSVAMQELSVAERVRNSVATLVGRPDYDATTFLEEAGLVRFQASRAASAPGQSEGSTPVRGLTPSGKLTSLGICDVAAVLPRVKQCLSRLQRDLDQLRPAEALRTGQRSPEHECYFLLRERWQAMNDAWQRLAHEAELHNTRDRETAPTGHRPPTRRKPKSNPHRYISQHGTFAREFDADEEIDDFLNDRAAAPELTESELQQRVGQLVADLAWFDHARDPNVSLADFDQRGILTLTFNNAEHGHNFLQFEFNWLFNPSPNHLDCTIRYLDPRTEVTAKQNSLPPPELCGDVGFLVEGPLVGRVFAALVGTCTYRIHDVLCLLRIGWLPLGPSESAGDLWRERQAQAVGLRENSTAPFGPLVIAKIGECSIDARTGLAVDADSLSHLFPLSITASLLLPQEFLSSP